MHYLIPRSFLAIFFIFSIHLSWGDATLARKTSSNGKFSSDGKFFKFASLLPSFLMGSATPAKRDGTGIPYSEDVFMQECIRFVKNVGEEAGFDRDATLTFLNGLCDEEKRTGPRRGRAAEEVEGQHRVCLAASGDLVDMLRETDRTLDFHSDARIDWCQRVFVIVTHHNAHQKGEAAPPTGHEEPKIFTVSEEEKIVRARREISTIEDQLGAKIQERAKAQASVDDLQAKLIDAEHRLADMSVFFKTARRLREIYQEERRNEESARREGQEVEQEEHRRTAEQIIHRMLRNGMDTELGPLESGFVPSLEK